MDRKIGQERSKFRSLVPISSGENQVTDHQA
jgi:hypothetical protein